MTILITEAYKEQNKALHARGDYGVSGHKWADEVRSLAGAFQARTILDYGCGRQTLGKAITERVVLPYDPCIPGLDGRPDPADLVVCGDVLEHVEPELIDNVLDDLQTLAKKAVFLVIATRPAKKILPDGRNAHLIQQPPAWWLPKIMDRWELMQFVNYGGEFVAMGARK